MPEKKKWKVVEIVVRGSAGVIVSKLDLDVPRFSFRVGTVKFLEEKEPPYVTPWLNTHNIMDGAELLTEVEEKYSRMRREQYQRIQRQQDGPLVTFKDA